MHGDHEHGLPLSSLVRGTLAQPVIERHHYGAAQRQCNVEAPLHNGRFRA